MQEAATDLNQVKPATDLNLVESENQTGDLLEPDQLNWLERRAHLSEQDIVQEFPQYLDWKYGGVRVTQQQIKELAEFTWEPSSFFTSSYLPSDSEEITDFRSPDGAGVVRRWIDLAPSLRQRIEKSFIQQETMREYRSDVCVHGLDWVGSCAGGEVSPREASQALGKILNLGTRPFLNTKRFLRQVVDRAGEAGVLVQSSYLVDRRGNRQLDSSEFNCFQLMNKHAPLVFVHGDGSNDAHLFAVLHGLAHLLVGEGGVDLVRVEDVFDLKDRELWCTEVALEFLVPEGEIRDKSTSPIVSCQQVELLADEFPVSPFIVLIRLKQLEMIDEIVFQEFYSSLHNEFYFYNHASDRYFAESPHVRGVGEPFAKLVFTEYYFNMMHPIEASKLLDTVYSDIDEYFGYLLK